MTNEQLYLAVGLPILFNVITSTVIVLFLSARIVDLEARINQRFDDMRELWRSELRRVEEIMDARLKHLEENR